MGITIQSPSFPAKLVKGPQKSEIWSGSSSISSQKDQS